MSTTSNTMGSAAGDVSITTGNGADTFDLISVSDIQYKFDINDIYSGTLTGVPFIIGSCSITVMDKMASGASFETELMHISQRFDLTIGAYTFPLYFQRGRYKADDLQGMVTFNLIASNDVAPGSNVPTAGPAFDGDSMVTIDVSMSGSIIESALADFGATSFIVESTHFSNKFFPTSGNPAAKWAGIGGSVVNMKAMAAVEGSFYGIGFNEGFFVSRESEANKVTVTQDDIISASRDISYPDLKSTEIIFNNDGTSFNTGRFSVVDNDLVNNSFRQELSVTVSNEAFIRILYDADNARMQSDTDTNSDTAALAVTNTGMLAYQDVLRASAPFTIKLTVEGFDTIKPWQPFDITDTTGKLSKITGRIYRGLDFSYSLDNTIQITAYAIV